MNTKPLLQSTIRTAVIAASLTAGLGAGVIADSSVPPAAQPHSDSVGAAISDTSITAKVKAKLAGDDRLKKSDISVTTSNGIVTLTGSAYGPDDKATAEILATAIAGVKDVDDELEPPSSTGTGGGIDRVAVKSKEDASDSWITTKVKSGIIADSVTKGFDVSVTTTHGAVVLKGTLTDRSAIERVKGIAERVKGVKSVDISLLTIAKI